MCQSKIAGILRFSVKLRKIFLCSLEEASCDQRSDLRAQDCLYHRMADPAKFSNEWLRRSDRNTEVLDVLQDYLDLW